jgi:DNA polymerase III epsilon subunit family exonuclease
VIGLGLRFRPASEFRDRAAKVLSTNGGLPADSLALHLFRLRQVLPPSLAERLVAEVLGRDAEFERDASGRWRYRPAGAWPGTVRLGDLTYCVVDIETTGGAPWNGHRVTEIGAVKIRGGRVVDRFVTLVNPERPIPGYVRELTGITDEMVAGAPRFADLVPTLRAFLEGSVFVGHNAGFDWRFLDAECARATGLRMEGVRLCTLRISRRLYPELEGRSLPALADALGVPMAGRHRAGDDADATASLFLRFLDRLEEFGVEDWAGLEAFLASRRYPGGGSGA